MLSRVKNGPHRVVSTSLYRSPEAEYFLTGRSFEGRHLPAPGTLSQSSNPRYPFPHSVSFLFRLDAA
jgi:hypothetical protein